MEQKNEIRELETRLARLEAITNSALIVHGQWFRLVVVVW